MELTEIRDKRVSSNLPVVEICIPKSLQDQGLTRLAAEHGTLNVICRGLDLRSTFYRNNIDKTIRGFNVQTYLHLHRKDNLDYATPKLEGDIRKLISRSWLVLIGVLKENEVSN